MKTILYTLCLAGIVNFSSKSQPLPSGTEIQKRNQVQQIYTAELGVKEKTGRNDGPRVEEYLRYAGLKRGEPWCAAFVCWVFGRAGIDNPRTGRAAALLLRGKLIWERKRAVAVGLKRAGSRPVLPQKGDVFGIWFPQKGRVAHAGFIDRWEESWLITVEGNTNEAGSREGDRVMRKRRLVKTIWAVAGYVGRGS